MLARVRRDLIKAIRDNEYVAILFQVLGIKPIKYIRLKQHKPIIVEISVKIYKKRELETIKKNLILCFRDVIC